MVYTIVFPALLGWLCLPKCAVNILMRCDVKFEISDGENLVKCGGKTLSSICDESF